MFASIDEFKGLLQTHTHFFPFWMIPKVTLLIQPDFILNFHRLFNFYKQEVILKKST